MNKLLQGSFEIEPLLRRAVELWCEYYDSTEIFDRQHCVVRSPHTGNAIPVTREEYRLCAKHARDVFEKLQIHLRVEGIDSDISHRAQKIALDLYEGRR